MHCRMRNARALRCKPDGWLPSWDSLTRLLQTLIVPEWRQSGQPAGGSRGEDYVSVGFSGTRNDSSSATRRDRRGRSSRSRSLLVDVLLEFYARGELGDFAGGDFDDGSGLRIAAIAGFAIRDGKRSKTDKRNAIALLQRERDGVNQRSEEHTSELQSPMYL